jgi:hypothetical protein
MKTKCEACLKIVRISQEAESKSNDKDDGGKLIKELIEMCQKMEKLKKQCQCGSGH